MTSLRLILALVAGLLCPAALLAGDAASTAPPFAMEKHYSADIEIALKNGMDITSKSFVDGDKMRSNLNMGGMEMAVIVRKDLKKMYRVMEAQKMVMVSDLNPDKMPGGSDGSLPEGKFELIGPDTIDGVVCSKYKVTTDKTNQVFLLWCDMARKIPVQMASADGSFTVKWKNFTPGAQDAALFEPPAGYQTMEMPMPGSGGAPAGPGGPP